MFNIFAEKFFPILDVDENPTLSVLPQSYFAKSRLPVSETVSKVSERNWSKLPSFWLDSLS